MPSVPRPDSFPWLTLAGLGLIAAELWWERRTRREIAWCRNLAQSGSWPEGSPPPLLTRWWRLAPFPPSESAAVYADHFEVELRMSRRAVWGILPLLAAGDSVVDAMARRFPFPTFVRPVAGALLAAMPAAKRLAQTPFNELEAFLPLCGSLAMLREQEVVWALAAAGAGSPCVNRIHQALPQIPVPSRARHEIEAQRPSLRPDDAALHAARAVECRQLREKRQRRILVGATAISVSLVLVGAWMRVARAPTPGAGRS